jgi:hypothetical protein
VSTTRMGSTRSRPVAAIAPPPVLRPPARVILPLRQLSRTPGKRRICPLACLRQPRSRTLQARSLRRPREEPARREARPGSVVGAFALELSGSCSTQQVLWLTSASGLACWLMRQAALVKASERRTADAPQGGRCACAFGGCWRRLAHRCLHRLRVEPSRAWGGSGYRGTGRLPGDLGFRRDTDRRLRIAPTEILLACATVLRPDLDRTGS